MLVVPIQGSGQKMASAGDGGDIPGRSVHDKLAVLWLSASVLRSSKEASGECNI